MAAIRRLPSGSYQAQIRRGKHYVSKSFKSEGEARQWVLIHRHN